MVGNADASAIGGFGIIDDNDPMPALVINDVSVAEGDSGTSLAAHTATGRQSPPRVIKTHYHQH